MAVLNGHVKLVAIVAVLAMAMAAIAMPMASDDSDAAPSATYNLSAVAGTYCSFDTNIPSNYAIPSGNWSLAENLPRGLSLNSGGDIVGTPLIPGYYGINYYINGEGNVSNTTGGKYIAVKINVTGSPAASVGTTISGPVNVSLNKNTSVFEMYQKNSSYFEVIGNNFSYYLTPSNYDAMGAYSGALVLEDYDCEGGISIYPTVMNFANATATDSTLFSSVTYSNGTMSFKFSPAAAGTYAVGLHVVAEGPGYGGGYEEYILTNVFTYGSTISVDDITVYSGQAINISNVVSSGTITVSGVSWLSGSGTSIVGTAPSSPETYNVTVSSGGSSDTFRVTVVTKLSFTSVPSNGVIAYAL
ncbi:MAG: hypothetical protein WCR24_07110 [Candidatus Methanomethylophilaceae archaeon]